MDIKDIEQLLDSHYWTFAKTMPKTPHWYIVKEKSVDKGLFIEIVRFIRQNGYQEKFFDSSYTYINIGKFKYWTMGNLPEETTIINRAILDL